MGHVAAVHVQGGISVACDSSSFEERENDEPGWPVAARTRIGAVGVGPAGRRAAEGFTDGELVTLAVNGAHGAFSHLLHRHAPHLRRLVARRLRDPQDVLDVIQDTHIAVWRALQTYDTGRPFEAWLTCIALNKCKDWARRRVVRFGMMAQVQADAAHGGAGLEERSAESLAIEEESMRDLERALERLPRPLREPLVLTALRDLPQAAVARELGATRKAVEMRVRRARQRLQQALCMELAT